MKPDMGPADREAAIRRGLAFIYSSACVPENFYAYGPDYLCCFYCIYATSFDADLRRIAGTLGRERARLWRRRYAEIPARVDADDVADLVFGGDAADRLGVRDPAFKENLRKLAAKFSACDYLGFDPQIEPPPTDIPQQCGCGVFNGRGREHCRLCRRPLEMNSAYWVWLMALTRTYTGERYGIRLGARFPEVLKWHSAMRPYPRSKGNGDGSDLYWALYAVTHIVYTLNDYGAYNLSPAWLPAEYAFLKRNVTESIRRQDPETIGELLDSLKAFGLPETHPLIRKGARFLLASQNADGSWGDMEAEDIYQRYHPTWTAIDGLREYAWRGERLSLRGLKPFLRARL